MKAANSLAGVFPSNWSAFTRNIIAQTDLEMSGDEENQGKRQIPYLDESLVIDTRLSEIERQQKADKEYERAHDLKQLRFNKLLMIFTGLLFVTSALSDILMVRYVSLTKQSADAAKSAAETSARALQSGNNSFNKTLEQMKSQTSAQWGTTRAAIMSDRDTEAFFRTDERARIGVTAISFWNDPNYPASVEIRFQNLGKTEAQNTVAYSTGFVSGSVVDHLTKDQIKYRTHTTAQTAFAGYGQSAIWRALPSLHDLPTFLNGQGFLYIVGEIDYRDIFNRTHKSEFCGYSRKNDKVFTVCPMHERAE